MNSVSTLSIAIASSNPSIVTATIGVSTGPPQPFATILAPFDVAAPAAPRQPAAAIGKPLPPADPGKDAPTASVLPTRETDALFATVAGPLTASAPSDIPVPDDQDVRSTDSGDREDRYSHRDEDVGDPVAYPFAATPAPQPIALPLAPTLLAAPPVSHDPAAISAAPVFVDSADAHAPAIASSIPVTPQALQPEASPVVSALTPRAMPTALATPSTPLVHATFAQRTPAAALPASVQVSDVRSVQIPGAAVSTSTLAKPVRPPIPQGVRQNTLQAPAGVAETTVTRLTPANRPASFITGDASATLRPSVGAREAARAAIDVLVPAPPASRLIARSATTAVRPDVLPADISLAQGMPARVDRPAIPQQTTSAITADTLQASGTARTGTLLAESLAPQAPAPGVVPIARGTADRGMPKIVAGPSAKSTAFDLQMRPTPASTRTQMPQPSGENALATASPQPVTNRPDAQSTIDRSIAVLARPTLSQAASQEDVLPTASPAQRTAAETEALHASPFVPLATRVVAVTPPTIQPQVPTLPAQTPESNAITPNRQPGESREPGSRTTPPDILDSGVRRNAENGSIRSETTSALLTTRLSMEPRIVTEANVGPPSVEPIASAVPAATTSPTLVRRETTIVANAPQTAPIPDPSRPVVTAGAIPAQSVAEAVAATPSPMTFAFATPVAAQPITPEPSSAAAVPFANTGVPTPVRPETQPIAPPAQLIAAAPTPAAVPIVAAATRPARLAGPTLKHDRADPAVGEPTPESIPQPLAATTAAILPEAPLDMGRHGWPQAMIARIEALRDAADAVDTSIRVIPDKLGAIDVSVRRDGDVTHVHFNAEQAQTRTILADAQPRLAELADARGLKLGQSSVDGGASQHQPQQNRPQQAAFVPAAPVRARRDEAATDDRIA